MTTSSRPSRFPAWSDEFKKLRGFKEPVAGAINAILAYYTKAIDDGQKAQRKGWEHAVGLRKKPSKKKFENENRIEELLLEQPEKPIRIVGPRDHHLDLRVIEQSFALAEPKKGQIVPDALGFIKHRGVVHPVVIEVKVQDNDPWFAVVENLIQIRFARSNVDNIEQRAIRVSLVAEALEKARGTWGLVVAPQAYFNKHPNETFAALRLISALRDKTRARIIVCSCDGLEQGQRLLQWINGSYWPR
jgi:hypothetical protein